MEVLDVDGRECGEDKNECLCGVCGFLEGYGSELILCDGPCLKSFHINCIKDSRHPPLPVLIINILFLTTFLRFILKK